jgi:signal transduction histidine kinase
MATVKTIGNVPPELTELLERAGFAVEAFPDPHDVAPEDVEGLSPVLLGDVGRYTAKGIVRGLQRDVQATQRFFANDPLVRDEGGEGSEQELRALIDFSQAVSRSLAKAEIVDAAARFLHHHCAAPALAIHYWSAEEGVQLARALGFERPHLEALERWLAGLVDPDDLRFRQGLDLATWGGPPAPVRLTAVVPILAKDVLLGSLSAELNPHYGLSLDTLKAMGRQLALSLQNGELLARSEQALASLQRAQESMTTSEKLAAVGLLAAGIAHEINNPTAFIITNLTVLGDYAHALLAYTDVLEGLVRGAGDPGTLERMGTAREEHDVEYLTGDTPELLARSLKGMQRIQDIVRDLKSFAHMGGGHAEWLDVNQTISQVLKLAGAELRHRANVELDLRPVPALYLESTRLSQVLLNLIINAYQAFGDRPKSENMIWVGSSHAEAWVRIYVADNGPGMSEEVRSRIFEPFFTTKQPGQGTGLGLSLSYGIVRKHGGRIDVESTPGAGSTFTIRLPVQQKGTANTDAALLRPGLPADGGTAVRPAPAPRPNAPRACP